MGLNKKDWIKFHTLSSYVFLFLAVVHFYQHFKSAIYSMKNKTSRGFVNILLISIFMICSISGIASKYISPQKNLPIRNEKTNKIQSKNYELDNTISNNKNENVEQINSNKNKNGIKKVMENIILKKE